MMPARGHVVLAVGLLLCWSAMTVCARPIAHKQHAHAKPSQAAAAPQATTRRLSQARNEATREDFATAPSCRALPSASNSTADNNGRLWGWNNTSCAFKDRAGHALFYADYTPGNWLHTPACSMAPFPESSVADSKLRVWSWEADGTLCAFKNDQQQPLPIQKAYNKLSWDEAPPCVQEATPTNNNSLPDKNGCLWGWQVDRNCAFKNSSDNQPLYYPGYQQLCNTTASTLSAAEFNAKAAEAETAAQFSVAEGESVALDAPTVVTGFGIIGQRLPLPVYSDEERQAVYEDKVSVSEADPTASGSNSAPFIISMVPADFGPVPEPSPAVATRRLFEVVDPKFPKQVLADSADHPVTGLACVTPPGHATRATTDDGPCLPEVSSTEFVAAEGAVTPPATPDVPGSDTKGPGGFSGPGLISGWDGDDSPSTTPMIRASEGMDAPQATFLSVGHKFTAMAPSRRLVSVGPTWATAIVTAVSSSDSSSEQPTVAIANAIATDDSTAVAVSKASNNSTVNATAIATDGHKAVAKLEASKGSCMLSVVVLNNKVTWHCTDPAELGVPASPRPDNSSTTPANNASTTDNMTVPDSLALMWQDAQPCGSAPNKSNSVPDAVNRLWGYDLDQQQPCAYKQADGSPISYPDYIAVKFETAPACEAPPTAATSMADVQLRLWGWAEDTGELCAVKDPSTGEPVYLPTPEHPTKSANTTEPAPLVSPSAAGPKDSTGDDGHSTKPSAPGNDTRGAAAEGVKGAAKQGGPPEAEDISSVVLAADAQARVISDTLSPNSTQKDIALASAKTAIIYQAAYEAAAASAASSEEPTIKAAEANTPPQPEQLPLVLLQALRQTVLHK